MTSWRQQCFSLRSVGHLPSHGPNPPPLFQSFMLIKALGTTVVTSLKLLRGITPCPPPAEGTFLPSRGGIFLSSAALTRRKDGLRGPAEGILRGLAWIPDMRLSLFSEVRSGVCFFFTSIRSRTCPSDPGAVRDGRRRSGSGSFREIIGTFFPR